MLQPSRKQQILPMKKVVIIFALLLAVPAAFTGCDLLDSSNVQNPNVLEETALSNPDPLQAWAAGLDRQLALAMNEIVLSSEVATDNYKNTQTFFTQSFDALDFDYRDTNIDDIFFDVNDLRESASYGLTVVKDADPNPRAIDEAESSYYLGLSHILLGEFFKDAPLDENGPAASSADHFNEAVSALNEAIATDGTNQTKYDAALARAHYNLGNVTEATSFAQAVLDADAEFLTFARFNPPPIGPSNTMQNGVYDRGTFDDLQPLPRLDFLDPKYYNRGGSEESPIPLLKAEEAHLILIEAALAEGAGSLPDAQAEMIELIELANSREIDVVDEREEGRDQDDPGSRPDTSSVRVAASPDDSLRSGLVRDRTLTTDVPVVSATSVTEDIVNGITTLDQAWEVYYLLRQEIFFGEGRRFVDFGIKLPLSQPEAINNPNFQESGSIIEPFIPSYILAEVDNLDAFEYDADAGEAVVTVNMNRVLAENRADVSPFLD